MLVNNSSKHAALIDTLGPGRISRYTSTDTPSDYGFVREIYNNGASLATPYVAGAAVSQKALMLEEGRTWINNPGRLQAQMLAMADSWHDNSSVRSSEGLDDLSGVGRFKARLFDVGSSYSTDGPWAWRSSTYSFSAPGTTSYMFQSKPLKTGTDFFKCVLWEGEDMSSKSDVSDVYIQLYVRSPVSGSCSSSGTLLYTESDPSYDIRHMTHIESSSQTLSDNCVEVTLQRGHITASQTTVTAFCYSAGVHDDLW